ncbi:MAG: ATP-dependent protease LonB [Candidatus Thermoplasmatota archaeon]|nr:ATP-dependent protease LonB [Candidatus Thermoplasmatota archaeon]
MVDSKDEETEDIAEDNETSEFTQAPPVDEWVEDIDIESTKDVEVPDLLADQVIGQDEAVSVAKKAAKQHRHAMLIGPPGTGKSMIAKSMTDYLPTKEMEDILCFPNEEDENNPKVRTVPSGKGEEIVKAHKKEAKKKQQAKTKGMLIILALIVGAAVLISIWQGNFMIMFFGILAAAMLLIAMRANPRGFGEDMEGQIPKLLKSHQPGEKPPFIDATGAQSGALLGDVKHDPFQSGGLETPSHQRVEVGAIHEAHNGVLFIDEMHMLGMDSQHSLLTAMQERKFQITGQSERSSGAMVQTEPVPTNFILVAAGNLDSVYGQRDEKGRQVGGMHPALRSRIRGYGYEVYVNDTMDDTEENRRKLVRFIAQEIEKDEKKIPHFTNGAITEIIREAQRRANKRGELTLRLRELGGLVRVAGDLAVERGHEWTINEDVLDAKTTARSLEQQVTDKYIKKRKEYNMYRTKGKVEGVVNGLAAMGGDQQGMSEYSGIILPIAAEVTPAHSKEEGQVIATGKLGEIAKEAVQNVSALIKKYTGEDISEYDVHIQFIGTQEGVEGDSASISVATAVISALENIPIDQNIAMTGSLSVRGQVLPVGGITSKIEAAAEVGMDKVLIPKTNEKDIVIEKEYEDKIEIVPVENLGEVLDHALIGEDKEKLLDKLASLLEIKTIPIPARDNPTPKTSKNSS